MMLLAAINWHSVLFILFALIACGFAVAVLATSNVVRMAFYLTLSLGATAGIFFLAGAEFVGAMQLMIYVGGTLVLLIFGVMLTAQARFISMKTSAGEWVMGGIVGATLLWLLLFAAFGVKNWSTPRVDRNTIGLVESKTSTPIGLALTGVRVDKLDEPNERLRAGMSGYLLPFVIVSMHLLVVLIGAGYMARTKRAGRGIALDRPLADTAPRVRRRTALGTFNILAGMLVCLAVAGAFLYLYLRPLVAPPEDAPSTFANSVQAAIAGMPRWFFLAFAITFLANAFLLVFVWYWQKWGAYGLILVLIAQAVILAYAGVPAAWLAGLVLLLVLPVIYQFLMWTGGRRPTAWSQMD